MGIIGDDTVRCSYRKYMRSSGRKSKGYELRTKGKGGEKKKKTKSWMDRSKTIICIGEVGREEETLPSVWRKKRERERQLKDVDVKERKNFTKIKRNRKKLK